MSGELPGEVYRALNVEGEGRAAADSRVVEQRRADLVHHLLQHRNICLFCTGDVYTVPFTFL